MVPISSKEAMPSQAHDNMYIFSVTRGVNDLSGSQGARTE